MTSFTGYWLTQGTTSRARVVFPMGAEPPRPSLNPGGDYSGEKARRSPLPIGGRSAPRLPASFSISYESEVQVVPRRSQLGERMMLSPIFFLSAELRPDPARPPTACSSSISSGTWRWFKTVTSHAGQRKSPDWRGFPRWGRTGLEPVTLGDKRRLCWPRLDASR